MTDQPQGLTTDETIHDLVARTAAWLAAWLTDTEAPDLYLPDAQDLLHTIGLIEEDQQ